MKKDEILAILKLQPLTEEEKQNRGILGRLVGKISTSKTETRNGRLYNEDLWNKALKDDLMQEKIQTKSLFLELGHPVDRTETDMSKVCACIPELPKIVDGDLIASVDILDTPNGKILNTLVKYGFIPGISSRGTGDVMANDEVDPETFMLETWDIVQLPAMKEARLAVVESLDTRKTLKQALTESLNNASEEDKKIMSETLENLNIKLNEEDLNDKNREDKAEKNSEETKEVKEEPKKAEDNGADEVLKNFQECLRAKQSLEKQLRGLQEKLAVGDAKETKLLEELNKYKNLSGSLSGVAQNSKALQKENSKLKEELEAQKKLVESQVKKIQELQESKKTVVQDKKLIESLKTKTDELKTKEEEVKKLTAFYESEQRENKDTIKSLQESVETLRTNSTLKEKEFNEKLTKANTIVEKYKKVAKETVSRYIESKSLAMGIRKEDVERQLGTSYTLSDIDRICESLQAYELNMSKLPFSVRGNNVKMRMTESKNDNLKVALPHNDGDDIDDDLLALAKLN